MKLLSRWFRRAPTAPSWIEPAALATRIEQDDTMLILDVRGPDEFHRPSRAHQRGNEHAAHRIPGASSRSGS